MPLQRMTPTTFAIVVYTCILLTQPTECFPNEFVTCLRGHSNNAFAKKLSVVSTTAGDKDKTTGYILTDSNGAKVIRFTSSEYMSRGMLRYSRKWTYYDKICLVVSESGTKENPRPDTYSGYLNRSFPYPPFSQIYGYDAYAGKFWFEILESNWNSATTESNSNGSTTVHLKSIEYGDYQFTFKSNTKASPLQIASVSCRKRTGSLYRANNPGTLGDGETNDYQEIEFRHHDFEFGSEGNFVSCKSFLKTQRKDKNFNLENMLSVTNSEPIDPTKVFGQGIRFTDRHIPNGTPVDVVDDNKVPYEFHDGKLVRRLE